MEQVGFNTKDISKESYQENRQKIFTEFFPNDDIYNYVPLYISSHTSMVHAIKTPYKKYYAILKVDIYLLYSLEIDDINKIKISNTSINRKTIDSSFRICNLVDILDEMDTFLSWNLFNNNTYFISTEKRLQKGSEILIPKQVAPQYILEVCPKCSEREIKNKYDFSDDIIARIIFNNQEFEFKIEERPKLQFDLNEDYDDSIEFDDLLFEENDENNDSWD